MIIHIYGKLLFNNNFWIRDALWSLLQIAICWSQLQLLDRPYGYAFVVPWKDFSCGLQLGQPTGENVGLVLKETWRTNRIWKDSCLRMNLRIWSTCREYFSLTNTARLPPSGNFSVYSQLWKQSIMVHLLDASFLRTGSILGWRSNSERTECCSVFCRLSIGGQLQVATYFRKMTPTIKTKVAELSVQALQSKFPTHLCSLSPFCIQALSCTSHFCRVQALSGPLWHTVPLLIKSYLVFK